MTDPTPAGKPTKPRKHNSVTELPSPPVAYGWVFALRLLDVVSNALGPLFTSATVVAVFYFMTLIVHDLAGKETKALIFAQFLADIKVTEWLSYGTTGVLGVYAWRQKRLREKTIERYAPERQALEKRMNPRRGTSGLTKEGRTHPDDK